MIISRSLDRPWSRAKMKRLSGKIARLYETGFIY
jgi:hypothetical protein